MLLRSHEFFKCMITLVTITWTVATTTSLAAARNSGHPSCQAARLDSPGLNLFQLKGKHLVILHLEMINVIIFCYEIFVASSLLQPHCCNFCQVGLSRTQSISISALAVSLTCLDGETRKRKWQNHYQFRFEQKSSSCLRSTR